MINSQQARAVTKSGTGTGTWDSGHGDMGTWTQGRGYLGLGDLGRGDVGMRGCGDSGRWGARMSELGDARGFEDVINKSHLTFALNW